jgi:hypothetical protein
MALPAFRAASTAQGDTAALQAFNAPAGLATDDIEFLVCESMDETISLSTTGGFVEVPGSPISVASGTATIATRGALFWRRYSGQADAIVADPGNHIILQRFAFSGCITTDNPWDIIVTSSEAVEDTTGSATGGTTTVADCLIAVVVGSAKPDSLGTAEVSGWTNADLANLTERADNARNEGNGGHLGLATGEKAAAGTFAATTYTKATAAFKWHFVVALKPVGAAFVPRNPAINLQDPGLLMQGWRRSLSGLWQRPELWTPDESFVY